MSQNEKFELLLGLSHETTESINFLILKRLPKFQHQGINQSFITNINSSVMFCPKGDLGGIWDKIKMCDEFKVSAQTGANWPTE